MKKFLLPIVTLIFCLFAHSIVAQQLYWKVGPLTQNAGADPAFRNYVEITSRQMGITAEVRTSGGAGAPVFQNVVITKYADILSNKLMTQMVKGLPIAEMEIVSTAPSGQGGRVVMNKIELKEVYVTSVTNSAVEGCEGACDQVAESYKLDFRAIKITTYTLNRSTEKWVEDLNPFMYNRENGKTEF